ncbi:DEAD-domain-containing protein [Aureobasidium pullulans]|nr:DEAD-domain-containing protein [Aureobasidium pullulans]THX88091.1 DEAD-domain-containing protein [Aureobasidium pullulans]
MSSQRCLKFVQSVFESFQANSGLEPRLLNGLRVTAARPGVVNFELPIEKHHTVHPYLLLFPYHSSLTPYQNRLNILHGGTIASMVDLGGSLAVASRGLFATGVSTDLNVTYLNSGGKIGDLIRAEVTCDKFGKTLAYTSINFHNEKQELVARGSHTKYVSFAWKDPNNIVEEMSPKPEK